MNHFTEINCAYCKQIFNKRTAEIKRCNKDRHKHYCSRKCQVNGMRIRTIIKCTTCGKDTINPKFCSRSCAAIYTNKHHIKRIRKKHFCKCGNEIFDRHRVCEKCHDIWTGKTIQDVLMNHTNKFRRIRDYARNLYRTDLHSCVACGYSKHLEICHIKSLGSFPLDTLVTYVNSPNNIIILCPRCHWEFDHKMLLLKDIILKWLG